MTGTYRRSVSTGSEKLSVDLDSLALILSPVSRLPSIDFVESL